MFKKQICLILPVIFCLSCNTNIHKKTLVIAGSTSVQPFVEALAETYAQKNKSMEINVQGGGSSAGIQSAEDGAAQIGMSSRHLEPEESAKLKTIVIAEDGIAVVVHPSNKIEDISLEDIKRIFSRQITNWKSLNGEDKQINAVTREDGSGTRGAFQELVMGKKTPISNASLVQDSNGSVREIVKNDPWAIGYISLGLVDKSVKAVKIDGVLPSLENAKSKTYNFVRPFLFVYKNELTGDAKKFVDFVLSDEGQGLLEKEGLIGVRDEQRKIN